MATDAPRLPPELERDIFELSARNSARMRYRLLFISRRVLEWIEPILYDTLIFQPTDMRMRDPETGARAPHASTVTSARPPEFLIRYVRHIVMDSSAGAIEAPGIYTDITHVAIAQSSHNPRLAQLLLALRNVRVAVFYPTVFENRCTEPLSFDRLTHLTLLKPVTALFEFCSQMPALTHLAIHLHAYHWSPETLVYQPLLDRRQPPLELLVLIDFTTWSINDAAEWIAPRTRDDRVVLTWWERFYESVVDYPGEGSFWDVAERFVREKRAGARAETELVAARGPLLAE
ncbi:hypothetical protein MKEN_01503600 [Mycena kentingensis (nom. inval.)]|nr:hypothetical protein MKEN_01503600 [Mycena kentingensis (nom. inval.)]